LIKPFTPYRGLLMNSATGTDSDYYSRSMTYCTYWYGYRINIPSDLYDVEIETDDYEYLPEYYNASDYVSISYEFHADTGKSYTIIDLGDDLTAQYMLFGAPTGWMEMNNNGSATVMLKPDYEHIIRLNDEAVDYTPLSGDSYTYGEEGVYYPGSRADLNSSVDMVSLVETYGAGTDILNFFYSISGTSKEVLSSRVTISPTAGTAMLNVSDSRYSLATFDISYNVYNYSAESGAKLYADIITVNSFGGGGLRTSKQILQGKSCTAGEKINLASLFTQKTGVEYSDEVTAKIYTVSGGKVNSSSGKAVTNLSYTYESEVAVQFLWQDEDGNQKTVLIYLSLYEDPEITVNGYTAEGHSLSVDVEIPYVSYSWMGESHAFYGVFYDDDPTSDSIIEEVRTVFFDVTSGNTFSYHSGSEFSLSAMEMKIAFTLKNKYGEIYTYYLTYYAKNNNVSYTVTDDEGKVYVDDVIKNTEETHEAVEAEAEYTEFVKSGKIGEFIKKNFSMTVNGETKPMTFEKCVAYTRSGYKALNSEQEVLSFVGDGYAVLQFVYVDADGNSFTLNGLYNITISGKTDGNFITDKQLFTGYEYEKPKVYMTDGNVILGECYMSVYKLENGSYKHQEVTTDSTFTLVTAGQYRINWYINLRYDRNGDIVLGGVNSVWTFTFCQDIEVCDGKGEVTITYVTDEEHPFASSVEYTSFESGGKTYYSYTATYGLASNIVTLGSKYFASSSDSLYAWLPNSGYTIRDTGRILLAGNVISDFISTFGTKSATLYAVWDPGLKVTFTGVDEEGNETVIQEVTYYRITSAYRTAYYCVDLNSVAERLNTPEGYEFLGWTGGVFGNEVITMSTRLESMNRYYFLTVDSNECTVKAVFKRYYKVTYSVNYDYCSKSFGVENVYEGETVSDVEAKTSLTCKVDGYEFKGWYVKGDESKTLVDLSTYVVTGDVTLVALFAPVEEE